MNAIITRQQLHQRSSKFAWKWSYSVSLNGATPVCIGTRFGEAERWARERGATQVSRAFHPPQGE